MILDDIRELRKSMRGVEERIRSYNAISAIQYDREGGQPMPNSTSSCLNRLIEDKNLLQKMKRVYDNLVSSIDMNMFTRRQKTFISLYYFNALSIESCARKMNVKKVALYRIKNRIISVLNSNVN